MIDIYDKPLSELYDTISDLELKYKPVQDRFKEFIKTLSHEELLELSKDWDECHVFLMKKILYEK